VKVLAPSTGGRFRRIEETDMKRILVGVDGSKESRDAARMAADIARATHSQLSIAYAVAPVSLPTGAPELVAHVNDWVDKEKEAAKIVLKEIAAAVAQPGLIIETIVQDGPPVAALAELCRTGDVDLVVVGHRGRGAIARALLGSVADRLVQISSKPVLVMR
jgi:nucleotide-binding universal stress UspA family protein